MAADVDEAVDAALVVTHHDHRNEPRPGGEVLAGLGHPVGHADVLPGAGDDPLLLEPEDLRVCEPRERQRDAVIQPGAEIRGHGHTLLRERS